MERMTPDTIDFNSLSKKQLVELVITKYNDCFKLEEENRKLKEDLANIQCEFGFECGECEFWKREMKKHKPCLIKEEYVFNLGDYDYMILTSTTPQLKIIKKSQNYSLMEEDTLQELRDLGEI